MSVESKPSKSLSPEAIAELVEGHRTFLTFLERHVESRAVAEDILQIAFVRGLESGAGVQDEKVVAWFYRVLRNTVIDHYRHRSASARALESWAESSLCARSPMCWCAKKSASVFPVCSPI